MSNRSFNVRNLKIHAHILILKNWQLCYILKYNLNVEP